MKKLAVFLIGFVALCGCSLKSEFLKDDFKYESAYMGDIAMRSFSIVDERKDVTDRRFNPKFFEGSGPYERVNPVLSDEQRNLIKGEILKHIGKSGRDYDFKVYVQKGEKALRSAWPSKYEIVNVSIRIEISNNDEVKACTGDASLEVKSIKATDEYLEQMYQKTIRECIHECFLTLKKMRQG